MSARQRGPRSGPAALVRWGFLAEQPIGSRVGTGFFYTASGPSPRAHPHAAAGPRLKREKRVAHCICPRQTLHAIGGAAGVRGARPDRHHRAGGWEKLIWRSISLSVRGKARSWLPRTSRSVGSTGAKSDESGTRSEVVGAVFGRISPKRAGSITPELTQTGGGDQAYRIPHDLVASRPSFSPSFLVPLLQLRYRQQQYHNGLLSRHRRAILRRHCLSTK